MLANIPATQTVIEIKSPGGPEMLVPAMRPVPEPKAGEVLIRIAASGVNRADCLQRMGRYPMPSGASDIPGLECSGTVVKTGEEVSQWQIGDRLCALMVADGYSEYAAVPAVQCLPAPENVSLVDAAGLPETFSTVWTNVFERMRLRSGEVFLVQGGTSGIGITAIQLAKAFGAKVLATAGTDEKCRACLDYGADVAINYRTQDFLQVGKEFTGGRGVDAILDNGRRELHPATARIAGPRGPALLCRPDAGRQGRGRFRARTAQAPDRYRFDLALTQHRREGGDYRRVEGEGLASLGGR